MDYALIDPLDMAPITPGKSSYSNLQRVPQVTNGAQRSFQEILVNQVKQQPTPVMMPDNLLPPKITSSYEKNYTHEIEKEQNVDLYNDTSDELRNDIALEHELDFYFQSHNDVHGLNSSHFSDEHISEPVSTLEHPASVDAAPELVDEADTQIQQKSFDPEYTIQRGDTLSGIIAAALQDKGEPYRNSDIYRLVNVVAKENGIKNPNQIYYGNKLNLSAIYAETSSLKQNSKLADLLSLNTSTNQSSTIQAPAQGRITSEFGLRTHPIHNDLRHHNGLDIALEEGTPIRPIKEGTVTFAGERGGYGNMVEIEHRDGSTSRYAHLSEIHVEEGVTVNPQDFIALSGNTGLSTGPHLHFEIREGGKAIDPLTVLAVHDIEPRKPNTLLAHAK